MNVYLKKTLIAITRGAFSIDASVLYWLCFNFERVNTKKNTHSYLCLFIIIRMRKIYVRNDWIIFVFIYKYKFIYKSATTYDEKMI